MAARTILTRARVVVSASLLVLLAAGCQTDNGASPEPSTSALPVFPYPPFEIHTDVAVPDSPYR